MKKFDINLFINLYIPFYVSFLLNDYLILLTAVPITYWLYKNLKKESLTPMVNYLIMLMGAISVFLFKEKSHSAIVLITSYISLYIFKGEEGRFWIGSIFLIILAAVSTKIELFLLTPVIFLFTIRELKADGIKFGVVTVLIIIIIIMSSALIPNYQGVLNNNGITSFRKSNLTGCATYTNTIYTFTRSSTKLSNKLKEIERNYKTLYRQQQVLNLLMFIGFISIAIFLGVFVFKYVRISGKGTFVIAILLSILIIVGLGFGFYKLIASMSGNWKNALGASMQIEGQSQKWHSVVKHVNIKPLLDKITTVKINIISTYIIIGEIILAITVILILTRVAVNVKTKGIKKIDMQVLEEKKDWFKNIGLSADIFRLYSQFRSSFPQANLTPREFERFFVSEYKISIDHITKLFEKARYMGKDLNNMEKTEFIKGVLKVLNDLLENKDTRSKS